MNKRYERSLARWDRKAEIDKATQNRTPDKPEDPGDPEDPEDHRRPGREYFDKDIDKCVRDSDPECDFSPNHPSSANVKSREGQITFFCGNALRCRVLGGFPAI